MSKRVYIPIFGSGLGHASRMAAVADRLLELGCEVAFSSFGEGLEYLGQRGYKRFSVPRLDVGWTASGKFEGLLKTAKRLPWHIATFIRQCIIERKIMKTWRPSVVLSDSRLSAVVAAKSLGLRCLVVINQLRILLPPKKRRKWTNPIERFLNEVLGKLWNLADKIFFPDLPPPLTVSEENLLVVSAVRWKAEYVGFMVRPRSSREMAEKALKEIGLRRDKPIVFMQISGPTFTKPALLRKAREAASKLTEFQIVISEGRPWGSTALKRDGAAYYFEWCPVSEELMAAADVLVVLLGKPMLIIPIADHSEQFSNAFKMARLGAALWLDPATAIAEDICAAVRECYYNSAYKRRAESISRMASHYDGASRIVEYVAGALG